MPQHHLNSHDRGRPAHWRALGVTVSRAALAVCLVCAATAVARAQDDDVQGSGTSLYDRMLQVIGVTGAGDNINYSERSPLVVPPTRDLPSPSAAAAAPVPDWPKDPDMTRRARAKVKARPHPHADYATDLARPLRPDELNAASTGSGGRGGTPTPGTSLNADYPERDYAPPKTSIFDWFSTSKQQYATFTGEPPRTSLTEPPAGYMTPSADQPYGIGPDQKKYKVPTVADRATPDSGTSGGN
jgi:hypothetical protein